MEPKKKIIFNASIRWAGEIIGKLVWFIFMAGVARYLGDRYFGYFSYAISLGSLLVAFTDLGTNIFLLRAVGEEPNYVARYLNEVVGFKLIVSVIILLVFLILAIFNQQNIGGIIFLFGLALSLAAFLDPFNSVYRAKKEIYLETLVMFIWRFLIAGFGLLGVIVFSANLYFLSLVFIIGSGIALLLTLGIHRKKYNYICQPTFSNFILVLKHSLPFGLLILIGVIFNKFNILVLQWLRGPQEVGWYSAAFKVVEGLFFVPTFYSVSVFPFLLGSAKSFRLQQTFLYSLIVLFLVAIVTGGLLFGFSREIINFLYGKEYILAIPILEILSLTIVFIFLNELFLYRLISQKKEKRALLNFSITLVFYIPLSLSVISKIGSTGAAVVLLICSVILFLLNLVAIISYLIRQEKRLEDAATDNI